MNTAPGTAATFTFTGDGDFWNGGNWIGGSAPPEDDPTTFNVIDTGRNSTMSYMPSGSPGMRGSFLLNPNASLTISGTNTNLVGESIALSSGATMTFANADLLPIMDVASLSGGSLMIFSLTGTKTSRIDRFEGAGELRIVGGGTLLSDSAVFDLGQGTLRIDGSQFIQDGASVTIGTVRFTGNSPTYEVNRFGNREVVGAMRVDANVSATTLASAMGRTSIGAVILNAGSTMRFTANPAVTTAEYYILDTFQMSDTSTVVVSENSILGGVQLGDAIGFHGTTRLEGAGRINFNGASEPPSTFAQIYNLQSTSTAASVTTSGRRLELYNGDYAGQLLTDGGVRFGGGDFTLSAAQTYTGGTIVDGTLHLTGSGSVTGAITVNGTLDLTNSNNAVTLAGFGGTGTVSVGAKQVTVGADGVDATHGVAIEGVGGTLVKTGDATTRLTGVSSYSGGTTITRGTLAAQSNFSLGLGALTINGGAFRTDSSYTATRAITIGASGGTIDTNGQTFTYNGVLAGNGAMTKAGSGTLILGGNNTYSGALTLAGGTLRLGTSNALGSGAHITTTGSVIDYANGIDSATPITINSNTTQLNVSIGTATQSGLIDETGGARPLEKTGAGTLILTANNTYSGTTTISAGTLQIGNGGSAGAIVGNVANSGTLAINKNTTYTLAGAISGSGALRQEGSGTTILSGNSAAFAGTTNVTGGRLQVDGSLGGAVSVASGASLSGAGTLGGDVTLASGATLSGTSGSTLTFGSLAMGATSNLNVALGASNTQALFAVGGNLTLDGTLNISDLGGYGAGVSRLFTYGGTLTDNGLALGSLPAGMAPANVLVQTSVAGQINIINSTGVTLAFWDGSDPAHQANGVVDGGNGTWQLADGSWTTADGATNGPLQPSPGFAIFSGTAGTVTVDNGNGQVSMTGAQFAVSGYRIEGGAIALAGAGGESIIRVGDGTGAGAGFTATIASELSGADRLNKTDLGTLVLTGANTYTGGTTISAGTLQIGNGGVTGAIGGDVANNGTLAFNRSNSYTFGGVISGSGAVRQDGAGTTILTATSTYTGGTTITAGTLQIGNGGTVGSITGDVTNDGTLAFNRSNSYTFDGAISGSGAVRQAGSGTTILTAANTYTGGTTIASGGLQIGNGGTVGSITGDVVNDGALAFNRSNSYLFAGVISGSGAVSQTGSGATILTGANSYAGGTTIAAGTLQLGNGGSTGSIDGDVTNDGAFVFNRSNTFTFSGIVSGTGAVSQAGTGTTILTAANTYSGGTTIASGTLQLGNGGAGGSITGDVVNNGTLAFNRSNTLTFGGVISGSGAVRQDGPGTTILTADNTYSGGTTIASGTLQLGNGGAAGSITGAIVNDGVLAINRSGTLLLGGAISGAGSVTKSGAGTTTLAGVNTYAGGTTIASGTLVGSASSFGSGAIANDALLIFDQAADGTLANLMSGAGDIIKQGAGRLNLTGASTWAGSLTVNGGALAVNTVLDASVTVASGAILGGSGTIANFTAQNGATIAPGNSIGTLTVNGNVTQAAGSTYVVELNSAGQSDRIVASGSAVVEPGAMLQVVKIDAPALRPGTRYTVLSAAGGVTGTYTLLGASQVSYFTRIEQASDFNNIYLDVVRASSLASAAVTPNQKAVASSLESLTGTLADVVALLPDEFAARSAFDQLSGDVHASVKGALIEESRFVRGAGIDRIRSAFNAVAASRSPVMAYASSALSRFPSAHAADDGHLSMAAADTDGFALWTRALGSWGKSGSDGNAAGFSRSTGGVLAGGDAAIVEGWRAGLIAGYSATGYNFNERAASGNSQNFHAGVYGGTEWGRLALRVGASHTWSDISTQRSVAVGGFTDLLKGAYHARAAQIFGELGYRFRAGPFDWEGFANVAAVALRTDAFTESGGAAALSSAKSRSNVTTTTLGLRASHSIPLGSLDANVGTTVGWRHSSGDITPLSTMSYTGGSDFTVSGLPIARDTAVLDVGIEIPVLAGGTLGLSYGGQYGRSSIDQNIKGSLNLSF